MHHNNHDKQTGAYIRKVLEFIQLNLSEDLSLQNLSGIANYSPFHFQRIFSEYVGETPKQYIIRLRLERIAHFLKVFPNLTISELAAESGFGSHATFSRAFKNFYGVSAEEFRKISHSEYSKICKANSNKCKISYKNSSEFYSLDFSETDRMIWKEKNNITTQQKTGFNMAFVSTCLTDSDAITNAFREINQWANPRGLINNQTKYIGMLLDIPFITPIEKCRYWAGIVWNEVKKPGKEIGFTEVNGGLHASFSLKGDIRSTLKSLVSFKHFWLDNSGYELKDVVGYEVYSENPALKPIDLVSREIHIPIRPE